MTDNQMTGFYMIRAFTEWFFRTNYNTYFILLKIRSFRFKLAIVLIISGLDVLY